MSDAFSGLDDLIKAIDSFEGEITQTLLMDALKHLNWNPELKSSEDGYVITIKVPAKHIYEYSNSEKWYPVVLYYIYDSPHRYCISSILPVDDLPEDFFGDALIIAKELAEKVFGDEKNYSILPERNRIRVEYVLQLDPYSKDDDSLELFEAFGIEEVCELVRKQAIIEYFYVEGLNKAFEKLLNTNGLSQEEDYGAQPSHKNDTDTATLPTKSKILAGFLALFLGGLGVHKFYLGKIGIGFLYLIFCWTGIPAFISFFEAFMLWGTSDKDFEKEYNCRIS